MLKGENRGPKLYPSDLEVLRKLTTCSIWVKGFKDQKKSFCANMFKARKPQIICRGGI